MFKGILNHTCILAIFVSPLASATTSILGEGENSSTKIMSKQEMQDARGAALISGQPYPSVTHGLKKHFVTWKKFGSTADYHSYNYIGNSLTPDTGHTLQFTYMGSAYHVGGDQWLADDISAPTAWALANSYLKEYHYQVLNPSTDAPSTYAFRETSWNRPISTFSW